MRDEAFDFFGGSAGPDSCNCDLIEVDVRKKLNRNSRKCGQTAEQAHDEQDVDENRLVDAETGKTSHLQP